MKPYATGETPAAGDTCEHRGGWYTVLSVTGPWLQLKSMTFNAEIWRRAELCNLVRRSAVSA